MIEPTVKNITEIIGKLESLKAKKQNLEKIPLDFPKGEDTSNEISTIEQLINVAVGQSPDIFQNQSGQAPGDLPIDENLALSSPDEAYKMVLKKLPSLSVEALKKLLDNEIPETRVKILSGEIPVTIRPLSISAAGCGYGSYEQARESSVEGKRLQEIQCSAEFELKKKVEEAKERRWERHIEPLIDEIERLLFPFRGHLKGHGFYKDAENVMEVIRQGDLSSISEVIKKLERIRYKLEVESQQSSSEKPAETEQKGKSIIVAVVISFILIILFELFVYKLPITFVTNHPHSYGIQGSIICLIPCLIIGYFKPRWRKWFWGGALIAFLAVLLSIL